MLHHQYIERSSGAAITEQLLGDRSISLLYHQIRENSSALFRLLTSARSSQVLSAINFDLPLTSQAAFLKRQGIDITECLDPPERLTTPRKVFERKIRYEHCRPMPSEPTAVVSPADARVITGSCCETSLLCIKDKFFSFGELFGPNRLTWLDTFNNGDFAVFRLTPDKYHYNHTPVSGVIRECYSVDGDYHSCNPSAIVAMATPYSKNRRVVTIIDTDVPGGTQVGLVAMIEVVALMIGDIVQAYSHRGYDDPQDIIPGLFVTKGQPKSLYRPGSSTDILVFQQGRIRFADDLLANRNRRDISSRFTHGFGTPLVETDIAVRSLLGWATPDDNN